MTGRPPRYTAELADRILQQLTRGRGLSDICAEPGMPCVNTVRQWMADDIEGFAARYSQAREIGGPRVRSYPTLYTAALADRIVQELAHGRALQDICAEPGMPCQTTVRHWIADDIEGFAARYRGARESGAPLVHHPTRYTAAIAERIAGEITSGRTLAELCREPGMPPETTIRQWVVDNREDFSERYRRAQEIGRALRGGPIPYSAELADRVLGELTEGRTLIEACDGPGMPSKGTVLLWVRRDQDGFAARYREAREIGSQIMVDELITIGDDSSRDRVRHRGEGGATEPVVDQENIHRSKLRSENRRFILTRAMPRIYGARLEVIAKHDAGDGWAELLKELDGKARGLPSEEDPTDEQ
jgi:transposase-like protein